MFKNLFENLLFIVLVITAIYVTITFVYPRLKKILPKQHNMSLEGMTNNVGFTDCQKCWGGNYGRTNTNNKEACKCDMPWDTDADLYNIRRKQFGCDPKTYKLTSDGYGCSVAPPPPTAEECKKCWGGNYGRTNANNKEACDCDMPWGSDADMYNIRREQFGCDPKTYKLTSDGYGCSAETASPTSPVTSAPSPPSPPSPPSATSAPSAPASPTTDECKKCWGGNYGRTNANNKEECKCDMPWDTDADMYNIRREQFGCDPKTYKLDSSGYGCSVASPATAPVIQQPEEQPNEVNIQKTEDAEKSIFCAGQPPCPQGCSKPSQITGTCPSTIFKETDGTCYKKCPYICSNSDDDCKNDSCCFGCGFKKFRINCDGTMIPLIDETPNDDIKGQLSGQPPTPTTQQNLVQRNMGDFNGNLSHPGEIKAFNSGQKNDFTVQYTCRQTTTGMFTDCGPLSANLTCYQNYA